MHSFFSHNSYLFLEEHRPQPGNTVTHISGIAALFTSRLDLGHMKSRSLDAAPRARPFAIHSHTTPTVHTLMDDSEIHCEVRDLVVRSAGSL